MFPSRAEAAASGSTGCATSLIARGAPTEAPTDEIKRLRPAPRTFYSGGDYAAEDLPVAGLPPKEVVVGFGLEDSVEVLRPCVIGCLHSPPFLHNSFLCLVLAS